MADCAGPNLMADSDAASAVRSRCAEHLAGRRSGTGRRAESHLPADGSGAVETNRDAPQKQARPVSACARNCCCQTPDPPPLMAGPCFETRSESSFVLRRGPGRLEGHPGTQRIMPPSRWSFYPVCAGCPCARRQGGRGDEGETQSKAFASQIGINMSWPDWRPVAAVGNSGGGDCAGRNACRGHRVLRHSGGRRALQGQTLGSRHWTNTGH